MFLFFWIQFFLQHSGNHSIAFHLLVIFIVYYLWFCSLAVWQCVWEFINFGLTSKWKIFSFKIKTKEYSVTLKKIFPNIIMNFVRKPLFVWYLLKVAIKPRNKTTRTRSLEVLLSLTIALKSYLFFEISKCFALHRSSMKFNHDILTLCFGIYLCSQVCKCVAVACYYLLWKKPWLYLESLWSHNSSGMCAV